MKASLGDKEDIEESTNRKVIVHEAGRIEIAWKYGDVSNALTA